MRGLLVPHASFPSRPSRPAPRLARLLLAVLVVGSASACMSWRVRPTPQPRAAAPRYFEAARVTAANGDVLVLHEVQVTQDSVVGWRRCGVACGLVQVGLPRSEVKIFEARRFNAVGTGAMLAAIGSGLFYLILATDDT